MCQFFSCISDGHGKMFYFDHKIRKKVLSGKLDYELDSHSSIADYYKVDEDKHNKYEYNPLTKRFRIDQINTLTDSQQIRLQCKQLDFALIVPELIIKPIFHPFKNKDRKRVTKKEIELLKKWDSVWGSVWNSVRGSVWDSVGDSVGDSVRDSVWGSVWGSVRGSVKGSVRGSVWGYTSSFFSLDKWKYMKHKKGENPFQPCINLWESGLVPSFDGKTWRLHGGKNANVLYKLEE